MLCANLEQLGSSMALFWSIMDSLKGYYCNFAAVEPLPLVEMICYLSSYHSIMLICLSRIKENLIQITKEAKFVCSLLSLKNAVWQKNDSRMRSTHSKSSVCRSIKIPYTWSCNYSWTVFALKTFFVIENNFFFTVSTSSRIQSRSQLWCISSRLRYSPLRLLPPS